MTQEEFIKVLDKKGYSYEIENDKIIVTYSFSVHLESLTTLPPDVEFNNRENVDLNSLTSLPTGVKFRNKGDAYLSALTSLPPDVEFKNEGNAYLDSITSLPPGVEFKNGGDVDLKSLIGEWVDDWKGNIEGIDNKRLLNLTIKQGMFI